jgi:hypothetical protein
MIKSFILLLTLRYSHQLVKMQKFDEVSEITLDNKNSVIDQKNLILKLDKF